MDTSAPRGVSGRAASDALDHWLETNATSGVRGLDDVLAGGLPAGRLYAVEGSPGAGKTTLALQFLQAGAQHGERCLYIALSETKAELGPVAASHGWTLDGIELMEVALPDTLQPEADYTLFHASEMELADTMRRILDEVRRQQPERLVVDSLSELRMLARDPIRYRRQILAFKHFMNGRGCTTMLLDDLGGTPADRVESLMHGVLMLESSAVEFGVERRRLRVTKLRGRPFRGGWHDMRIHTGGLAVYPRLVAAEHVASVPDGLMPTGQPALDHALGGGLECGTSLLILGPAGTGKSTLALQVAMAATQRGGKAAAYMFDERVKTVLRRSEGLGWDVAGAVANHSLRLRAVDPAELSPGELVHDIRRVVDEEGVEVVIIDSISGYLQAMGSEPTLIVHLHELLSYLSHRGVVTILVMTQHGIIGHMHMNLDLSYLADSVLLLRYFEYQGQVRKALSVLKNRSGVHESSIREYWFANDGVHIGEPLTNFSGVLTGTPKFEEGPPDVFGAGT